MVTKMTLVTKLVTKLEIESVVEMTEIQSVVGLKEKLKVELKGNQMAELTDWMKVNQMGKVTVKEDHKYRSWYYIDNSPDRRSSPVHYRPKNRIPWLNYTPRQPHTDCYSYTGRFAPGNKPLQSDKNTSAHLAPDRHRLTDKS